MQEKREAMAGRRDWERDAKDWPNRETSRFVEAAGLVWHVQVAGSGPTMLLAHGTGAATHSWRGLLPLLARRFRVVAPDLPGHGYTLAPPPRAMALPSMAAALAALVDALAMPPDIAVGHSAGAAILARASLDRRIAPVGIVALNGAMVPFGGLPGRIFSPAARVLAALPVVPELFAWRARAHGTVERLMTDTGSRLDPAGIALYRRLFADPGRVAAALAMMANWDLEPLVRDLPGLEARLALVVGTGDRAVPPSAAARVASLVPHATIDSQKGLGHLAHEEDPAGTAEIILKRAAEWGVV
jgi:magnesium chelatase accessory protein